jgi:hypothetical protein
LYDVRSAGVLKLLELPAMAIVSGPR